MTKLKFDSLTLGQFNSFTFVSKKKNITNKKLTSKLVSGVCLKEGEDYKIRINAKALKPDIIDKGQPDILIFDFTEESYNLRGVVSVFSRNTDDKGKYTRYIRNESKCKFFPGNKDKLVPFCPNWVCNGYIVRHDGKLMFDFNDCLNPEGYEKFEDYEL